jgi:hypothetical protein
LTDWVEREPVGIILARVSSLEHGHSLGMDLISGNGIIKIINTMAYQDRDEWA